MGMAWYKVYNYIYLPLGILSMIMGMKKNSFILFPITIERIPNYLLGSRYAFFLFVTAMIIIFLFLIFGLHRKKMWAWYLNLFGVALFILVGNLLVFKNFQTYICFVLLYVALWFVPNFSYFNRRKYIFS